MKSKNVTEKTLNLLLSGRHPQAKQYAGKHVLVIADKIIPLKKGKEAVKNIEELGKKYGKMPTLVFVPRQDVTYILTVCWK